MSAPLAHGTRARAAAHAVAAALALAAGCADPGPRVGIAMQLHQPLVTQCERGEARPAGELPCGVDRFRLCAWGPHLPSAVCTAVTLFDDVAAGGTVELDVEPGDDVTLSFQAFGGSGTIGATGATGSGADTHPARAVWCGRAGGLSLRAGETTPVELFLTLCGDFTRPAIDPALAEPRAFHSATALPGGLVLLAGGVAEVEGANSCGAGCRRTGHALQTAAVYDAATGELVRRFGLKAPRAFHAAAALPSGRVVLAGGVARARLRDDGERALAFADEFGDGADTLEIVDPLGGASILLGGDDAPTRLPGGARAFAAAATAADGRVFILGGLGGASVASGGEPEVLGSVLTFDGSQSADTALGSFAASLGAARWAASVAAIDMGRLCVAGGAARVGSTDPSALELVSASAIEEAGGVEWPVLFSAAASLPGGGAVITGGTSLVEVAGEQPLHALQPTGATRVFDPAARVTSAAKAGASMKLARALHTATALPDGRVLVAGGVTPKAAGAAPGSGWPGTASTELRGAETATWSPTGAGPVGNGELLVPRVGHAAVLASNGNVVLSGGLPGLEGALPIGASATLEVFNPAPARPCGFDTVAAGGDDAPACRWFLGLPAATR